MPNTSFDIKNTRADEILKISDSSYRRITKDMKNIWVGFVNKPSSVHIIDNISNHPNDVVKKFFEIKYRSNQDKKI
jgi:hypothetical protein